MQRNPTNRSSAMWALANMVETLVKGGSPGYATWIVSLALVVFLIAVIVVGKGLNILAWL